MTLLRIRSLKPLIFRSRFLYQIAYSLVVRLIKTEPCFLECLLLKCFNLNVTFCSIATQTPPSSVLSSNILPEQIKTAKNWETAFYTKKFRAQLGLPPSSATGNPCDRPHPKYRPLPSPGRACKYFPVVAGFECPKLA